MSLKKSARTDKIVDAFAAPFEETAGIFSDMVIPKQCLKVREGMGKAVSEELREVYEKIAALEKRIENLDAGEIAQ
ncbi:MAG: hypothetical protein ACOYOS_12900 [Syntrophales bacterium]